MSTPQTVVRRDTPAQFHWSVASLLEHYTLFASLDAHHIGDRAPFTDDHLHATAETVRMRQQNYRRNTEGKLVPGNEVPRPTVEGEAIDQGWSSDDDGDEESDEESDSDDSDDDSDGSSSSVPGGSPVSVRGGRSKKVSAPRPWCHCCLLAFGNVYSLAWAAFQSGGVSSLLAFLHSHFQWGSGRAGSICAAASMRQRLDCGGMAAFFIHISREVKRAAEKLEIAQPDRLAASLAPFPFTVVGICLVLTCSAEERRRWMSAARRGGGDVSWIGPSSSASNQGVCYHQCMGLIRQEDGHLWVWDDGKFLLPPQADLDTQHRSIVAIKVTEREVPVIVKPVEQGSTGTTPIGTGAAPFEFPVDATLSGVNQCRFGGHLLGLDQWYSFLPKEYAFNPNDDLGTTTRIINIPFAKDVLPEVKQDQLPIADGKNPVVFISGMAMNDDNPAPGSGISRAMRAGTLAAGATEPSADSLVSPYGVHLIGVDYSMGSAGMECEAIDEALIVDSWESVSARDHTRDILRRLTADPLAFWLPASDCETALIAKGLHLLRKDKEALVAAGVADAPSTTGRDWSQASSRVLIPPFAALDLTAKPCLEVARILGMDVPPAMLIDRASRTGSTLSLHSLLAFTSSQRGPYWVKGELFGACMARHYSEAARAIAGMQSAIDQAVLIQLGVQGMGRGVAFAAVDGVLTGAIGFTKAQNTALLKGWSGVLETVDADLMSRIEDLCRHLNYTGGGELEFVECIDGRRSFIDFNARFPAWISASMLAQVNLPAALLQHALHEYSKQSLANTDAAKIFNAEVPFPTGVSILSRTAGRRVHYTRTITEIVSRVQPAVLYATFDQGMAGDTIQHLHPARLIDMARVYSQDEEESTEDKEKDRKKKDKSTDADATSSTKKSKKSKKGSAETAEDAKEAEKRIERIALAKSAKKDKVGSGVDKYLPLLSTAWFDGTVVANAGTTTDGATDALDYSTVLAEKPLSSDSEVDLATARAKTLRALVAPKDLSNSKLVPLVLPSLNEKLWVLPMLHVDIPDVLSGLSLLAPQRAALALMPTPCFVVSTHLVRRSIRAFQEALAAAATRAGIPSSIIGMSVKTQPLQQVLKAGLDIGAYAEVISLGELRAALDAGYTPEHIIFNGPGKNVDRTSKQQGVAGRLLLAGETGAEQLKPHQRALSTRTPSDVWGPAAGPTARLASINADSVVELRYIVDAILDPTHYIKSNSVGIRLTPPLNPSRFGANGASFYTSLAEQGSDSSSVVHALVGTAKQLLRLPEDITFGIHFHFASSTLGWSQWLAALYGTITQAVMLDQLLQTIPTLDGGAAIARSPASRRVAYFDLGGGFPAGLIAQPHVRTQLADIVCYLKSQLPAVNCVYLEPGKSLSERAGAMLTTVQHTREMPLVGEAAAYAQYDIARFEKDQRKRAKKGRTTTSPGSEGFTELPQAQLRVGATRPAEIAVVDSCVCDLGSIPTHAHPLLYLQASRIHATPEEEKKLPASTEADVTSLPSLGSWRLFPTGPSILYGRICMEWDILGLGLRFPDEGLVPGDKILMGHTGAYDMSMAYEFGRGKEAKTRLGAAVVPEEAEAENELAGKDVGIYFI